MTAAPKDWRIPLVDSHAHIFLQSMPLINNPRHAPKYSYTVDQYINVLNAHGIQYGVIAAASHLERHRLARRRGRGAPQQHVGDALVALTTFTVERKS